MTFQVVLVIPEVYLGSYQRYTMDCGNSSIVDTWQSVKYALKTLHGVPSFFRALLIHSPRIGYF